MVTTCKGFITHIALELGVNFKVYCQTIFASKPLGAHFTLIRLFFGIMRQHMSLHIPFLGEHLVTDSATGWFFSFMDMLNVP